MYNWNEQIMKEFIDKNNIESLLNMKNKLDDLYYNTGNSNMSDEVYDILKDHLIEHGYNNVGHEIQNNRVKLPYYMGSIDKITPKVYNKLDIWKRKNICESLVITDKLDGVSCMLNNVDNNTTLYTRGDGNIGGNISFILPYLVIPKIKEDISIRGELILKKSSFNKYSKEYKNARNMVSGLINSKKNSNILHDVEFIVYEIIHYKKNLSPDKQLFLLDSMGFKTVHSVKTDYKCLTIDNLVITHEQRKNKSLYEIDGIVVQTNKVYQRNIKDNPKYMFAFKMLNIDNIRKTAVIDIEWSITKWNKLIPVAILKPIKLKEATISRVSLSNANLMIINGIGPGSIVDVVRSNDVIPYITKIHKKATKLKWPSCSYEWDVNHTHITAVHDGKESKMLEDIQIQKISLFFKRLKVNNIQHKTISKFYYNGYKDIYSILNLNIDKIKSIDGLNHKSACRIVNNIRKSLDNTTIPSLIYAKQCLGYGISERRIETLFKNIPDILTLNNNQLEKEILQINGFSEKLTSSIIQNINNTRVFVDRIKPYVSIKTENNNIENTLNGQIFCFSGFRDKDLEQSIKNKGGKTSTSITSKTTLLIVKTYSNSQKIIKANKLNIPIVLRDDFELYTV